MRNYSIRPRDDGRAAKRVLAMPLARANGWFDDEIAIDFPSLHGAVERMRACFVAASLGLDKTPAFDVTAACSGFLYALDTGAAFILRGPVSGTRGLRAMLSTHPPLEVRIAALERSSL